MGFVAFDDPRLAGPVRSAVVGDSETNGAIAALRKALLSPEHGVLSALSLGFPVNVIGLRTTGGPVAFLNPTIVAASEFGPPEDETFVLTDIVRRQVRRPRRIVVVGQRETGEEASFTSEGISAVQALQHLELIAGDGPMRWLSPTERLMLDPVVDLTMRQSIRTLYAAVNDAGQGHRLYRGGVGLVSLPVSPAGPDGVARLVAAASAAPTVDFRLRDPILPATPAGLLLFALAVAPARRQHAVIVGSGALATAVSLKHVFPQLVLDVALPCGSVADGPLAQLHLRPDDRLRLQDEDLQAYEQTVGRNQVDVILTDLSAATDLPDDMTLEQDFRSLSRVLRGEGGLAVVTCARRDPRIERALKSTFVCVDCWTVEDHGAVYLAAKRRIAAEMVLGRITDMAVKFQNPGLRSIFAARITSLGKDGQDRDAG